MSDQREQHHADLEMEDRQQRRGRRSQRSWMVVMPDSRRKEAVFWTTIVGFIFVLSPKLTCHGFVVTSTPKEALHATRSAFRNVHYSKPMTMDTEYPNMPQRRLVQTGLPPFPVQTQAPSQEQEPQAPSSSLLHFQSIIPEVQASPDPHQQKTEALQDSSPSLSSPSSLFFQRPEKTTRTTTTRRTKDFTIPDEFLHGMPWKTSIDPKYINRNSEQENELFYMPFWEYQISVMQQQLTNLRVVPVESPVTGCDLSYRQHDSSRLSSSSSSIASSPAPMMMRMHTLVLASDEFRRIRLTVIDGGKRLQVFTSVWYPAFHCSTSTDTTTTATTTPPPIFGVDLLQFGQRKHVCISDLQPIHDDPKRTTASTEEDSTTASTSSTSYEEFLAPIRQRYPSLQNEMSDRFYDHQQFFSSQMLLGRYEGDDPHPMVYQEFFPAYTEYLQTYLNLVQSSHDQYMRKANKNKNDEEIMAQTNRQRQAAYDDYSAQRDPAHAMLSNCFGSEFAHDYVYNVLFPLATPPPLDQGDS